VTRLDVLRKVKAIEDAQRDHEMAHGLEDDLYRQVLSAIAHGAPNAAELANAALYTQTLDFKRWHS
jgi:hypothetical protein